MGDITEEIIKKTENLEIKEAEFEKWDELLPKIKLECIKKLDFMTRWNLRNTSKTERNLVNSQRFNKYQLDIFDDSDDLHFLLFKKFHFLEIRRDVNLESFIPFLKFILENCDFEKIEVKCFKEFDKMIEWFPEKEFISEKKLIIECEKMKDVLFWIRKTNDRLEDIEIKVNSELDCEQIFSEKKIANVRLFQLIGSFPVNNVSKLAQIWIDNDGEIGKRFRGHLIGSEDFAGFKGFGETFSDRIISKTDRIIRIRTNDEEKHILLERGTSTFGILDGSEEFLRMTVISSKMKESEYESFRRWVRHLSQRKENMWIYYSNTSSDRTFACVEAKNFYKNLEYDISSDDDW